MYIVHVSMYKYTSIYTYMYMYMYNVHATCT